MGKHGYLLDVTDFILKDQDLMTYQKNLEDLLDTASLINFYAIDDAYYYSDEFYELIDREPRKTDKTHSYSL